MDWVTFCDSLPLFLAVVVVVVVVVVVAVVGGSVVVVTVRTAIGEIFCLSINRCINWM